MAQRTVVRLTDDLSGVEIPAGKGETVTFSLDGRSYEIDLTAKNANALRKALRPYIEAGRPIKGSRRRPTGPGSRPTPAPLSSGPGPTATRCATAGESPRPS